MHTIKSLWAVKSVSLARVETHNDGCRKLSQSPPLVTERPLAAGRDISGGSRGKPASGCALPGVRGPAHSRVPAETSGGAIVSEVRAVVSPTWASIKKATGVNPPPEGAAVYAVS